MMRELVLGTVTAICANNPSVHASESTPVTLTTEIVEIQDKYSKSHLFALNTTAEYLDKIQLAEDDPNEKNIREIKGLFQ